MERLLRKWETTKTLVPAPIRRDAPTPTRFGALYYGSTSDAMDEAASILAERGMPLDLLRLRAVPFADAVMQFIAEHERVFVVEQNRDGQMRSLLINEGDIDPKRLCRVLHYDGTPITAQMIANAIAATIASSVPAREPVSAAE
jgi:2-oxoglutarate ferredoxin oxidoreductase subunit alpha